MLHRDHGAEVAPSIGVEGLVAREFQADAVEGAERPARLGATFPHPVRISEETFAGSLAIGHHRAVAIEEDLIHLRGNTMCKIGLEPGDLLVAVLDLARRSRDGPADIRAVWSS